MSDRTALRNRILISRILVGLALTVLVWSVVTFQTVNSPVQQESYHFTPEQKIHYMDIGVTYNLFVFREYKARIALVRAAILLLIGGTLLIAGLLVHRQPAAIMETANPAIHPLALPRRGWITALIGTLLLWVVAEANTQLIGITALDGMNSHIQFALIVAGIALVTLGMGGVTSLRRPRLDADLRREVLIVLAVTVIGFALRAWHLGIIRVLVDEVHYTSTALYFESQHDVKLLTPMTNISPFPWFYSYWVAGTTALFGHNFTGARMVSAIIGTLNIPALYFAARTLFDRKTALLAAILLATFPPHLNFSRLSMLHVCDALAGLVAVGFLARGLRDNRRMDFAIAGAAFGLTQYFYEGGRLLFPGVILLWLIGGFFLWRYRPGWRGLVITLMTALIVAAPVYYTISGLDTPGTGRLNTAGLGSRYWKKVLSASPDSEIFQAQIDRTLNPFLLYISVPDASIFYAGNKPLMLVYVAPFFLMGLFYAIYHWQKPGALLLFLWLLLPPMGVSLLIESGISVRFVVVFPAMVLAAAVGIRYVLPRLLPDRLERYAFPLMIALVVFIGAGQVYYYFVPHLEVFNRQFRLAKLYPDGEDAIFRSADLPEDTRVVLISDPIFQPSYARQVFDYFQIALSFESRTPEQVTDSYLNSLTPNRDYAFFIPLTDTGILERLQAHFRLQPPRRSPYADEIPDSREFLLFFAPGFELDSANPTDWQP